MYDIIIYDIDGNPIDKLYQYDTCVKIQIKDLDLKEAPIVHFANRNTEKAYAILREYTEYENGTVTVEIPCQLLEESLMIYVYLYAYDTKSKCGRTTYVGKIPVEAKQKPEDYVDTPEYQGINAADMHYRITKLEDFRDFTYVQDMNSIKEKIETETKTRYDSDVALQNAINSEISSRQKADTELTNNLNSEIQNRTSADANLTNSINQEIKDRKSADTDLQNNINETNKNLEQEITDRKSADNTLQSNLDTEQKNRTDADTNLQNQIDALDESLSQETSNRESADTSLQTQITANKNAISVLNGTGTGSVSKQIDDAFNDFATKISDDGVVNTYKELVDYAAEHSEEAAAMAGSIAKNTAAIESLETYVGTVPDNYSSVVEYVDGKDAALISKIEEANEKAATAEQNAKTYADQTFVPLNDLTHIFNLVYPIGSLYITKDSESTPEDLFGGTWEINSEEETTYFVWERLTLAE